MGYQRLPAIGLDFGEDGRGLSERELPAEYLPIWSISSIGGDPEKTLTVLFIRLSSKFICQSICQTLKRGGRIKLVAVFIGSLTVAPAKFLINSKGKFMNKSELIEVAAKEADISKAAAGKALDAIVAAVTKAVSKGDSVTLIGFGTFSSSKRAARTGRNPQTGKELKIAATTVPKFKAGAGFKAAVAGKKKAAKK